MKLIVYRRNKRKLEYTLRYEYYMQQSLVCTDSTRNPSSNKKVKKKKKTTILLTFYLKRTPPLFHLKFSCSHLDCVETS